MANNKNKNKFGAAQAGAADAGVGAAGFGAADAGFGAAQAGASENFDAEFATEQATGVPASKTAKASEKQQ
ncbi:hypothetical protein [Paenibacillus sp. 1001270B_150601_E10]|uniref:hypothetical protein n=1 Tax=Paenibacillus sp. 1001270B_150601_E10 TaxID=2787079 RepID=UPI00189CBBE6|nr:hypothetical protein [Paenibacillus sp. 1001270B_150601_E10]